MVEICFGAVSENDPSASSASSSRATTEADGNQTLKFIAGGRNVYKDNAFKKARLTISSASAAVDNRRYTKLESDDDRSDVVVRDNLAIANSCGSGVDRFVPAQSSPRYGVASMCGRRRDMEDAVAVHPSFIDTDDHQTSNTHYFGVFDGHGCSHVARMCKNRLHVLVREELNKNEWKKTMEESFCRMDEEAMLWNEQVTKGVCRCELHGPESYGVGSTAVVAVVTPDKIIVANCGDSRAVLCRKGKAVPLSNDHKPDRPDELKRIEDAGGRVLYWDGARVSGVLAMSRAIGDNYLKPYVTCEPEVTITERTIEDDCLILASDGLWDVVSNDTACGVARMCLKGKRPSAEMKSPPVIDESEYQNCDLTCSNASLLLTKLALARRSADNVSVVVIDLRKNGSL
ncbi:putative protein-serine/threonine phosphatase [Helianthus annuus]|nr:putative protein-serine/threonine phosphatase [Helianthus annuus]